MDSLKLASKLRLKEQLQPKQKRRLLHLNLQQQQHQVHLAQTGKLLERNLLLRRLRRKPANLLLPRVQVPIQRARQGSKNPMRRLKSLDKRVLPAAHSSEDQSCALTEQNETGLHGLVTS